MALTEADLEPIDAAILAALVKENKDPLVNLADMANGYREIAELASLSGRREPATIYAMIADDIDVLLLYVDKFTARKEAE